MALQDAPSVLFVITSHMLFFNPNFLKRKEPDHQENNAVRLYTYNVVGYFQVYLY